MEYSLNPEKKNKRLLDKVADADEKNWIDLFFPKWTRFADFGHLHADVPIFDRTENSQNLSQLV